MYFAVPDDSPENVTVSDVMDDTVQISWLPPPVPNGVIVRYDIFAQVGCLYYLK